MITATSRPCTAVLTAIALLATLSLGQGYAAAKTPDLSAPKASPTAQPSTTSIPEGPTYKIRLAIDIPVILTAGMIALSGPVFRTQVTPPHCAPLCDDKDLWFLDKPVAGNYSEGWSLSTDILLGATLLGTFGTLFLIERPLAAVQDMVVLIESMIVASSLATITAVATRRPRPYVYGEEAPLEDRESSAASLSFFSGHSAVAFASTTSMFSLLRRRFPNKPWQWIWLAISGAISTMVAVGRVGGGNHFPTDVIAGSVVGISSGIIIPWLHERPDLPIRVAASPQMASIAIPWD